MFTRLRLKVPELVSVSGGAFLMGLTDEQAAEVATRFELPAERCSNETPAREVQLDSFEIGRGPVSCAEYLAFVVATDHLPPDYWVHGDPPRDRSDHPVVGVSFDDARAYCRWLSTATDRTFRLPTEAEWERAARGDDARIFPWGDEWHPEFCNTGEERIGTTSAVGTFTRDVSPFGCVDMAGNVEEWTGTIVREDRVEQGIAVRGGSWNGDAAMARSTCRHIRSRAMTSPTRGFRVVCVDE